MTYWENLNGRELCKSSRISSHLFLLHFHLIVFPSASNVKKYNKNKRLSNCVMLFLVHTGILMLYCVWYLFSSLLIIIAIIVLLFSRFEYVIVLLFRTLAEVERKFLLFFCAWLLATVLYVIVCIKWFFFFQNAFPAKNPWRRHAYTQSGISVKMKWTYNVSHCYVNLINMSITIVDAMTN